jgi:hypothetical protein
MTVENLNITVKTNADKAAAKLLTLGSALEKVQGSAASVGGGAGTRAAKGVEKVGKAAEKANKPLGNFLSSLKRIAFYRIIRGIIKSITQAFQEGLEKAYLFSSSMSGEGNRFAAAMDRMKSAGNQMNGQLGSAFISLLAAVEPILIALINLVTKAADAISQFLAAFTGKTYLKANATAAKFADNMARGGAAAKEWKNQLLGFDEINRLNEPNQGGGGGGTNPLDGYDFVDTPIDPEILRIVEELKPQLVQIKNDAIDAWAACKKWWNDPSLKNFIDMFRKISKLITDISKMITGLAFDLVLIPIGDFIDKIGKTFGMELDVGKNMRQLKEDILGLMDTIQKFIEDPSVESFMGVLGSIADIADTGLHFIGDFELGKLIGVAHALDDIGKFFGKEWHIEETVRGWKEAFDKFDLREWFETKAAPWLEENKWRTAISVALAGFTGGFSLLALFDPVEDWWNDHVAPWFTVEKWKDLGRKAIDGIREGLQSIALPKFHFSWSMSSYGGEFFGKQFSVNIPWPNLEFYAQGGFPKTGDLFFAKENGAPELVGSMGGRTAVANNDQIVEGIRQGVYDAVVAANGNGGGDVQVKVYLDNREIKAGQQRLNRAWGV